MKIKLNDLELDLTEEQVEDLKKQLEDGEFPKINDKYWCVADNGEILCSVWKNYMNDKFLLELGNIYPTEEEAERAFERMKSRKPTWLPKSGEDYWFINLANCDGSEVDEYRWCSNQLTDWICYHNGLVFKTEAEAEAWVKKYRSAYEGK